MPQADVSWSHSTVGATPRISGPSQSWCTVIDVYQWLAVTLKVSERSALLLLLCFSMNDLNKTENVLNLHMTPSTLEARTGI